MLESSCFKCTVLEREYYINSNFTSGSSGVVYLLGCKVCRMQYVGSTFTSCRAWFNNYKSASRKFSGGVLAPQAELFRHFTEGGHHGLLEDASFQIIDRVKIMEFQDIRRNSGRLQSLMPEGLNARFVDH